MSWLRISILRLLVGWWMVPIIWAVVWPLGWLMCGDPEETTEVGCVLTDAVWNGRIA